MASLTEPPSMSGLSLQVSQEGKGFTNVGSFDLPKIGPEEISYPSAMEQYGYTDVDGSVDQMKGCWSPVPDGTFSVRQEGKHGVWRGQEMVTRKERVLGLGNQVGSVGDPCQGIGWGVLGGVLRIFCPCHRGQRIFVSAIFSSGVATQMNRWRISGEPGMGGSTCKEKQLPTNIHHLLI